MRKLIISFAAAAAAAALSAVPATAQYRGDTGYDQSGYGQGYAGRDHGDRRVEQLRWRLDRAQQTVRISRSEYRDLRQRIAELDRFDNRRDDRDGYDRRERFSFDRRYAEVSRRIDIALRDGDSNRRWDDRRGDDRRW